MPGLRRVANFNLFFLIDKSDTIMTTDFIIKNMRKKERRNIIPDIREFTDDNGKKWVQTSTDDLFSMRELNDIISSIEKERAKDEVVLARIDFQKVDREFYDAAVELQRRLQKQTKLLRDYVNQSNTIISRKNQKLKELIDYIKKLHRFLAYLNANPDDIDRLNLQPAPEPAQQDVFVSEYEEVEELEMSIEGD